MTDHMVISSSLIYSMCDVPSVKLIFKLPKSPPPPLARDKHTKMILSMYLIMVPGLLGGL